MRIAVYLRVSSDRQTVENQQADIERWLSSHNVNPADVRYYTETESAWKANHQHKLAELMGDIVSGVKHFDILLCWSLDRLSRQGIKHLIGLVDKLKLYQCRVISVKESWTEAGDNSMTEMFYAFIAWAAKFESDRKSERVKAAHARLKAKGKHIGRPKGKKDKIKRSNVGYLLRYATKKVSGKNTHDDLALTGVSK